MASLSSRLSVYSDGSVRREQPVITPPRFRVAWDDETSTYDYKSRTQATGYVGPTAPPAVFRFSPYALPAGQKIGDYRVNISGWEQVFKTLNDDTTGQDFAYWTRDDKAQFNQTGWPMLAYLVMSGNRLQGVRVGEWFRFVTLRPDEVSRAAGMTINTHPHLIHRFTCVKWDGTKTVHINSTGTPRGDIFYPLISKEGYGFIPWRNVVQE